ARIPIFDGSRKFAGLKGRAHAAVLAPRHAACEDERLGAAADPAEQGTHLDVVAPGPRQDFLANLPPARLRDPKRSRIHRIIILPRCTIRTVETTRVYP